MSFPRFTNLGALAAGLKKNGKHATLHHALNQAWRAESCLGDLKQAKDCCDILNEYSNPSSVEHTCKFNTVERALLTTALLLYARATSTSGKGEERGSIQLERGLLSKEQWEDHQSLLAVRNQSLAHVNPAHQVDSRSWHKVMLFAVQSSSGVWRPAASSNETGFHMETYRRLKRMLPVADRVISEKFNKRMSAVSIQLNEAKLEDKIFIDNQFDPVEVFGSPEAVQRLLEGSSNVTDSFWVNQ